MGKKDMSSEITKIDANTLPAFLEDEEVIGIETLSEYVVPPRVKTVQKQAMDELLKYFGAGDVILSPLNALIAEMPRDEKGRPKEGETASFYVVPIFFYPEWATWNPIELKGSEPAIKYRTVDPTDPIVAKSKNPSLRFENVPNDSSGKLQVRHVEHLNYIVVLYGHPLGAEPCILSFSRGEHNAGSKFAALIRMRKASLFGCVFKATVNLRHGQLGDWYGIDLTNPDNRSPWVTKEEYLQFKELHEQFAKYHKEARLRARLEYDSPEPDEAATEGNEF